MRRPRNPRRRHRNTSVTDAQAGTTTLDWFPDGRLSRIQRPGTVDTIYAYDRAGRVEAITHTVGASALTTLAYSYDLNGNRQTETLTHAGQPPVTSSYVHDEADRLQSVTKGNTTTVYTLDEVGNRRIERVQAGGTPVLDRTCSFDARDRRTGCTDAVSGSTEVPPVIRATPSLVESVHRERRPPRLESRNDLESMGRSTHVRQLFGICCGCLLSAMRLAT